MRNITCYVYDKESTEYVTEYLVTVGTKEGYTKPTVGDMDELEESLTAKLHESERALKKATWTPFDLYIEIDERGSVRRDEMSSEALQEQADQYDADSVRHLR